MKFNKVILFWLSLATISLLVVSFSQGVFAQTVYTEDFEAPVTEWLDNTISSANSESFLATSANGTGYGSNALILNGLPEHSHVTVTFDLYIIQSWDGNGPAGGGPDNFILSSSTSTPNVILYTNFANYSLVGNTQAYPAELPPQGSGGENPARTGQSEGNHLGYGAGDWGDATYSLSCTFEHSSSDLDLTFTSNQTEPPGNEGWGMDNVEVSVTSEAPLRGRPCFIGADHTDDFVTTWKTDNPGTSSSTSITVPMIGGPYDVDWNNDGIFDQIGLVTDPSNPVTHDFGSAGTYTIRIRGTYDSIYFANGGDKEKIISLDQWGTNAWTSMAQAFYGATNLLFPASDTPDISSVTDMSFMFSHAALANPNTSGWDTSAVTSMKKMFLHATSANPDTSGWDTAAVTDMSLMFSGATSANPETSGWDTSAVIHMAYMFAGATSANPDTIGWDTSAVTNMDEMFGGATSANPDTSGWDTSAVTSMLGMFWHAPSANPDTSGWDTAAVTDMRAMFEQATSANPDTNGWDTSAVTDMSRMFYDAISFDQDIGSRNVTSLTDATDMFTGVTLSTANYDSLLIGWDAQALQPGVTFSGGSSQYCSVDAIAARANMISSDGWVITDGGEYCEPAENVIFVDGFEAPPCEIDGVWAAEARDCTVEDCSGDDGRYMSWDGKVWCRALITQEFDDWVIEVPPDVTTFDFWVDWGAWDMHDCGDGESAISISACGLNEPVLRDAEEQNLTCDVTGLSSLDIIKEKDVCEYVIIGDPYFH